MFNYNPELKRVELKHNKFANLSEVHRLKTVLALEKGNFKAKRAILRVLTDKPVEDDGFVLEAKIKTEKGTLAFFGLNSPNNMPSKAVVNKERKYLAAVLSSRPRPIPTKFDIIRLEPIIETALELEKLYKSAYSFYPEPLDTNSILKLLRSGIPYAVLEKGKIVSVLFGEIFEYGELTAVEYNHSVTKSTHGGISMTTALAARIRREAIERFIDPILFAETIAAPVMYSCHQLGMEIQGILPEHYRIRTGGRDFTNFYVWSI